MYIVDYKELGKRVRIQRKNQNLTQEKLADMADISDSFMGHIERGTRAISLETLVKLANALSVSVEYLLQKETPPDHAVFPKKVQRNISKMSDQQRRFFMGVIESLSDNPGKWGV